MVRRSAPASSRCVAKQCLKCADESPDQAPSVWLLPCKPARSLSCRWAFPSCATGCRETARLLVFVEVRASTVVVPPAVSREASAASASFKTG